MYFGLNKLILIDEMFDLAIFTEKIYLVIIMIYHTQIYFSNLSKRLSLICNLSLHSYVNK